MRVRELHHVEYHYKRTAAMTALQSLNATNKQLEIDAEPDLHRLQGRHRGRQRRLLVDRDHHAVGQQGAFHRSGRARPWRRDGRCRLHGDEFHQGPSRRASRRKLVAAKQPGVDKAKIQSEIAQLQEELKGIASAASFSGANWLSVDSSAASYSATQKIVSSFSRGSDGSISIGTIDIDLSTTALFDASATAAGLLEASSPN